MPLAQAEMHAENVHLALERPRALDLFSCAGGAGRGLQLAGFHVTGVDIRPMPRYAGDAFVQADALRPPFDLRSFDFVWASPPCQLHSRGTAAWRSSKDYPDLIGPTRELLLAAGVPFVIENVPCAPIRRDLVLKGRMFGLRVERERWFELGGWWCMQAQPVSHPPRSTYSGAVIPVYSGRGFNGSTGERQPIPTLAQMSDAMGIHWMRRLELTQAIPPAYSEFIGRAFLAQQETARAA